MFITALVLLFIIKLHFLKGKSIHYMYIYIYMLCIENIIRHKILCFLRIILWNFRLLSDGYILYSIPFDIEMIEYSTIIQHKISLIIILKNYKIHA